jgi:hypothetical protein
MQNKTNNNQNQGSASYLTLAEPASQPSQVHIVCTFLQLTTTTTKVLLDTYVSHHHHHGYLHTQPALRYYCTPRTRLLMISCLASAQATYVSQRLWDSLGGRRLDSSFSLPGQWAGKAEVRLGTPAWECDLFGA